MIPETVTALEAAIGLFAAIAALGLSIYALLRADMRHMRGEMLTLRTELKAEIEASEGRLQGNIRETAERLDADIKASEGRLGASIKANADRIESVERKVGDLGERVSALGERVAQVDGKLEFLYRFITRQNEPPAAPAE
ncbi:MAG: hypothetical protein OXE57_11865 [Alphaproteobacteria bacterium]|nr:hypothetical protein [Alphaproteobacteria bacterium]